MFTTQQDVRWWATRYRFSKTWKRKFLSQGLADLRMVNYTSLLVAAYTHLFNYQLKQRGKCL